MARRVEPLGHITLDFDGSVPGNRRMRPDRGVSSLVRAGTTLFAVNDETAHVERLEPVGAARWGRHRRIALDEMVELPARGDREMDIEGLAVDGDWLWLVGGHALVRKRPDPGDGPRAALRKLGKVRRAPNRCVLAALPLAPDADGVVMPVARDGVRRAAWVAMDRNGSALLDWLGEDRLLAPFLSLPAKENGLDIEGLAVRGDQVFLGLRGPVLRGYAVILELSLRHARPGRLKARKLEGGRRFRRHLLDLDGLGIRDLALKGEDLLILAGPTLHAGGPACIHRWRNARTAGAEGVVPADAVERLLTLPASGEVDRAEAMLPWPEADGVLVFHDAPAGARRDPARHRLSGDLYHLRKG